MADRKQPAANSSLEWITAIAGALIALGLLGAIGLEMMTRSSSGPAAIVVEATRVTAVPGGFAVEIAAHNLGGRTAAAVQVEGALMQGGTDVETSEATMDYVPGNARRRGGLFFTRNPAHYRLELRATGYQEP